MADPPPPLLANNNRGPQDALSIALLRARRTMWKHPPRYLPSIFGPLREFFLDPSLTIGGMLLPLLTRRKSTPLNRLLARLVETVPIALIQVFYHHSRHDRHPRLTPPPPPATKVRERRMSTRASLVAEKKMRTKSRQSLLVNPSAPGSNRVIMMEPPGGLKAMVTGSLAFCISVIGDILGALTNPQKYKGWVDAGAQLENYLSATGVADELHQAIVTPLLHGRLLDNIKMLSDLQESHLCVDPHQAARFPSEKENPSNLREEITWGHKWMRYATAAYGVEMIRSALDREVVEDEEDCCDDSDTEGSDSDFHGSSLFFSELGSAIAFHCEIEEADILLVYKDTQPDNHILHHFLAIDRDSRSIVLALRGTLSLSGAIEDIKGMATTYCGGQAHLGMAEMADNVWKQSGEAILRILDDTQYQGYTFVLTGHSLGAGTACLLNIKLHVQGLLGTDRAIRCYAFAPPPTFMANTMKEELTIIRDEGNDAAALSDQAIQQRINQAIQHTVAYVHDNDVVPHLSLSAVRRLAFLFEAVDQQSQTLWAPQRWKIFYDYAALPPEMVAALVYSCVAGMGVLRDVVGACELVIPARVVVWCVESELGKFEAYACDPQLVAQGHIVLSLDMLTDHLPDQYEDALDALLEAME